MTLCWICVYQVGVYIFGGVAQLGERLLCKQDVESSNLFTSTSFFCTLFVLPFKVRWYVVLWRNGSASLLHRECLSSILGGTTKMAV